MHPCIHTNMHCNAIQSNATQCSIACIHTHKCLYTLVYIGKNNFFFVYTSMKTCIFKCIMYEKRMIALVNPGLPKAPIC